MSAALRGSAKGRGAWGRRALAVALAATLLAGTPPSAAQSFLSVAASPTLPLPAGLASVWRVDGRKLDDQASAWSLTAFSTDGRLVGFSDDSGTRIYRASDGRVLRVLPAPLATGQFAFSLAISATGMVAVGRVGGVELHDAGGGQPAKYHCGGVCGPVSALAFSPNGAWLAFQAPRGLRDATPGLVNVVDVRKRTLVAELEASAIRAGVLFAADGRTLIAANVTRIDDNGTFGVRGWNGGAAWRKVRDELGGQAPLGSIGPFAFDEHAAAYSRDGRLELRELTSGKVVWTVPLVPPGIDAVVVDALMRVEIVAFARRGDVVLSYESPTGGSAPGTLVFRRLSDGATIAMYDVAGVSALAIAPDGASFVYSTGAGRTYTVLARVPR